MATDKFDKRKIQNMIKKLKSKKFRTQQIERSITGIGLFHKIYKFSLILSSKRVLTYDK